MNIHLLGKRSGADGHYGSISAINKERRFAHQRVGALLESVPDLGGHQARGQHKSSLCLHITYHQVANIEEPLLTVENNHDHVL